MKMWNASLLKLVEMEEGSKVLLEGVKTCLRTCRRAINLTTFLGEMKDEIKNPRIVGRKLTYDLINFRKY